NVCKTIKSEISSSKPNIENLLDRIRLYRELLEGREDREYAGIKGISAAKKLDAAICAGISQAVTVAPPKGLKPHLILGQWLRALHTIRESPVEIFTSNYDPLFETAMEEMGVPFFDGFVGAVAPFFAPESVDADESTNAAYPPKEWTRLWKM